jgi:hypothetical protein
MAIQYVIMLMVNNLHTKHTYHGNQVSIKSAKDAYYHANYIVKDRWLEGEFQIMFSEYASDYTKLCELKI